MLLENGEQANTTAQTEYEYFLFKQRTGDGNKNFIDAAYDAVKDTNVVQVITTGNRNMNMPYYRALYPYFNPEAESHWIAVAGLQKDGVDANGNTTSYTYDSSYNLQTVTNPESTASEPIVTSYEYNTMGLKSAEISPAGDRTEYLYNNNGKITQKKVITDNGSEITQYSYDLNGNVITEKSPNQVVSNDNGIVNTYYSGNSQEKSWPKAVLFVVFIKFYWNFFSK